MYLDSSCKFRIFFFLYHCPCKSYAKFYFKDMIEVWEKDHPGVKVELPSRRGMAVIGNYLFSVFFCNS